MVQRNVVALVSGGLDSLLLTRVLLTQCAGVLPLYMRCGFVWEPAELYWLTRWLDAASHPRLKALHVVTLPMQQLYERHWSLTGRHMPSRFSPDAAVYLPGRNIWLLSTAALYGARHRVSTIALGTLAGNPFGDATPTFFSQLAACLRHAFAQPVRIVAPLRRFTKARLIAQFPAEPLHLTFSCLHPQRLRHCGRCNKCAERQRAFRQAGVPDPTSYAR